MHCPIPFYIRNLSNLGFGYLQGTLEPIPPGSCGRTGKSKVIHGISTVKGLVPPTSALFKGQLYMIS